MTGTAKSAGHLALCRQLSSRCNQQVIQDVIDACNLLGDAAHIKRLRIGLESALQADSAFDSPHDERREVQVGMRQ